MRIAQEPVDFLQELCGDFLGDAKRRDWQSVSAEVEVQLVPQDNNETYVLPRSRPCAGKKCDPFSGCAQLDAPKGKGRSDSRKM